MGDGGMTSRQARAWLINGLEHALRLDRGADGRVVGGVLLRKADLRPLSTLRVVTLHGAPEARPLQRLATLDAQALAWLWRHWSSRSNSNTRPGPVPGQVGHVARLLRNLGVDAGLLADYRPPRCVEPGWLVLAGCDRYRRPFWLHPETARAWQRLHAAALRDGIALEVVSGWRSASYQARLIARKLADGQSLREILRVSALPGYSEHHLGRALDLHAGDGPVLDESFERTDTHAWLQAQAHRHGFRQSYPRDNPYGIAYEPWHWCHA